jgi:hypothetical protein
VLKRVNSSSSATTEDPVSLNVQGGDRGGTAQGQDKGEFVSVKTGASENVQRAFVKASVSVSSGRVF